MQSTLDALGKNPSTNRTAPSTLTNVIVVLPATRVRTSCPSLTLRLRWWLPRSVCGCCWCCGCCLLDSLSVVACRSPRQLSLCSLCLSQGVTPEGYAAAVQQMKAAGAATVDMVNPKDAIDEFCG